MTEILDGVLVIEPETEQMCVYCGKYAETRPYGPGGAEVCFDCAMNSTPEMKRTVVETFADIVNDA